MRRIFIILFLLMLRANGATNNAASASAANVQSAINASVSGDWVQLPSNSSATWTTTVTISAAKGINLNLNGCTITMGSGGLLDITTNPTNSTRVTTGSFTNTGTADMIEVNNNGGTFTDAKFRLDNLTIQTSASSAILVRIAKAWGLIDHCTVKADDASEMIHNEAYGASDSTGWTVDIDPDGSGNAVYIEDSTFSKYNQGSQFFQGTSAIQSYYGAITIMRHCTFNYCQIDQHGTAGAIGARWWEVYFNTFNCPANSGQSTWYVMRAGTGVIYNNTMNVGSGAITPDCEVVEEDSGYPALYQIGRGKNQVLDPAYMWANTQTPISQSANVVDGRDFFSNTTKSGYAAYTYPHPLQNAGGGGGSTPVTTVSISGTATFNNAKFQ